MPYRTQDLHDLNGALEVRIETVRDEKSIRSTIVWIIVDSGDVFVRSVNGARGRWYREALATPEVTIDDAGRRLEARAVPVNDPESIARVDAALKRKYRTSTSGLPPMLMPEATIANLRLDPRFPDEESLQAPAFLDLDESSDQGELVNADELDAGRAIDANVDLHSHKSA